MIPDFRLVANIEKAAAKTTEAKFEGKEESVGL
jgi:hypothetical protein